MQTTTNPDLANAIAAQASGDAKAKRKALERFVSRWVERGSAADDDVVVALDLIDADTPEWARATLWRVARFRGDALPKAHERYLEAQRARQEAEAARKRAQVDENRRVARARMLISTTQVIPGREIVEVLGLVAGHAVMSRNVISDYGSDVKNNFGGRLGGVEKAVESARREATTRLIESAKELDADAVVAIDTSVQTVADKAQLVMMVGTAVTLAPTSAPQDDAATQV